MPASVLSLLLLTEPRAMSTPSESELEEAFANLNAAVASTPESHPDYEKLTRKKPIMSTTATTSTKAMQARQKTLALIQQAQNLLNEAASTSSPLEGWANSKPKGPYYQICDFADEVKSLWHRVNNAPLPTGYWEG